MNAFSKSRLFGGCELFAMLCNPSAPAKPAVRPILCHPVVSTVTSHRNAGAGQGLGNVGGGPLRRRRTRALPGGAGGGVGRLGLAT